MTTVHQPEHSIEACSERSTPERIRATQDALDFLGGKWKLPILQSLATGGKQRFRELERSVTGITPKMLSKELHDLEMNRLVHRRVLDTKPVSVEYEITEYSATLFPVLNALSDWGLQHRALIMKKG